MSTTKLTRKKKVATLGALLILTALLVTVGLLLQVHAPGNMGTGFLSGAGAAAVAAVVMGWRTTRHPDRATTFERGWTQTGDERDDAVLTHALGVLGLLALPMTGAAAIVIALGADTPATLAILLFAEITVLGVAFVVINRRS